MTSKYKYYKIALRSRPVTNFYRVDENESVSLWMAQRFQPLMSRKWSTDYDPTYYTEISEEELALEILHG